MITLIVGKCFMYTTHLNSLFPLPSIPPLFCQDRIHLFISLYKVKYHIQINTNTNRPKTYKTHKIIRLNQDTILDTLSMLSLFPYYLSFISHFIYVWSFPYKTKYVISKLVCLIHFT